MMESFDGMMNHGGGGDGDDDGGRGFDWSSSAAVGGGGGGGGWEGLLFEGLMSGIGGGDGGGGSGGGGGTTSTTTTDYDSTGYAAYLLGGGGGGASSSSGVGGNNNIGGGGQMYGYAPSLGGGYNNNVNNNNSGGAYSLCMPGGGGSQQQRQQQQHGGYASSSGGGGHRPHYDQMGGGGSSSSSHFENGMMQYMTDAVDGRPPPTNYNTTEPSAVAAQQQQLPLPPVEIDYCDAMLQQNTGMDDPSLCWLAGTFNGGGGNVANNVGGLVGLGDVGLGANAGNGYGPPRGGFGMVDAMAFPAFNGGGGGASAASSSSSWGGGGGMRMAYQQNQQQQHQGSGRGGGGGGGREAGGAGNNNALDEFIAAHLEQRHHRARQAAGYQQRQAQFHRNAPPPPSSSSAAAAARQSTIKRPCHRVTASSKIVGTAAVEIAQSLSSSSTRLAPNTADHSSLPSAQIDPLLERVSLTVTAVSLEPLSGNEVVRHIRTKTDDVITRFLPCVDFLVNCQQELRQGLQVAQASQPRGGRRNVGANGRSRAGAGMTPRQFHAAYVAPLPRRFERQNESLMAREHLRQAAASLESLVGDAAAAMPQGCDHVKNAFLGGMRENESWGLRKWLSKHGGAGSICNDLEEVMRHVKALRKDDETTKRLAEMLRPIARQAHERLKKDVPQAYQERSSAHPYLPFFHRLEACLKQMATYDPEEDDVVCLADSSDEEEDVKVLTTSPVRSRIDAAPAPVAAMAQSSPVKKRDVATIESKSFKRRCDEDENAAAFLSKWVESYTAKGGDDVVYGLKQSMAGSGKKIADQYVGERNEDDDDENGDKGEKRTKAKEPEIICLYSTDEDDDENDTTTAGVQNIVQDLKRSESSSPEPIEAARFSPPQGMEDYGKTCAQHGKSTSAIQAVGTEKSELSVASQWRCDQCTFLNEAFASKCAMCNDDDSAEEGNTSDDLANFLGETTFLDNYNSFFNIPDPFARVNTLSGGGSDNAVAGQKLKGRALQSADARELECLAEHISGGGSLPKQAHQNIDKFWAMSDTFPQILMLFRSILQNPTSHRFLEPVNESLLFMMGFPPYTSIIKHPLCFHEIVCALSRSDDAVKYPHLTMRLSNGKLAVSNVGELQCWNMWNGLHLIEAIDLVLLNSLAYTFSEESKQLQSETESLRDSLWEGVNGMLKRLLPHERRDHLPQRRSVDSSFVVVR